MVDFSSVNKWPNVPACYGWLSLDRRGRWRLQGEPVSHAGLIDFIQRQYGVDEQGQWFVQNGPQRVFVSLAYTPWIARWTQGTHVVLHSGLETAVEAISLDEEGNVLFHIPQGIALLDDRDLLAFLSACRLKNGDTPEESDWLSLISDESCPIFWEGLAIGRLLTVDVPKRFGFVPNPLP